MKQPNSNLNPESEREAALFQAAAQLTASARAAFLESACHGDPALRQRLEARLAAREESDGALADPPPAAAATIKLELSDTPDETIGQRIGHYKILENVGEGGCGVVYVAEQTEPVRRRVALKVIKLGMDTKQVVARFEAERQALAMMDHPNIAKVFDAGATETGRPYFVMELVRGIRITDYCDQNNLPTKERLGLFINVCQAIQHAHQKGIIHRDIKPSNILVTLHDGVPVPKVIDFGIAKATEGRLTDATVYTQLHQFIGTPAYMSPEQAEMSGLDIDTRSDVYSLGVLLYELLAGKTPFEANELMSQGIDAMRKIIREKEPIRPSTKLATLKGEELTTTARRRSVETSKLANLLRGDLDWIVMKCLEKDRTRRYETANGLAFDLKRHLNNEPVLARPPSALYRLQKSLKRNKLAYVAGTAVATALLLGAIVSAWQAVSATNAKREAFSAEREQNRLRIAAEQAQANEVKQKAAAQQGLYDSLLGQARATRLARQPGYRDSVFELLKQAKALDVPQKNPAELRKEAVAALGDFVGLTPATFTNFSSDIESAYLAPSGKLAAFKLDDATIRLLEMPSGKELANLSGTNGTFDHVCFNATGDQLFAACGPPARSRAEALQALSQRRLYSWARDADGNWQQTGNRTLPGVFWPVNQGMEIFATTVDARALDSATSESGYSFTFRPFNITTGALVAGCQVAVTVPAEFAVSAKSLGTQLAVIIADAQNYTSPAVLNVYDWKTGQRLNQLHLPSFGFIDFSPDGKYLSWLSSGAGGGAIYALPGLEPVAQFKENFAFSREAAAVFSETMVSLPIHQQNRIRLWDLAKRENAALLDEPEVTDPVAFSADGNFLLSRGKGHARFYQLSAPEKLDLPSHAAAVPGIAFSPDGKRLASVDKDRVLRVCDAVTGRILWQTNDLPGAGQCVSYSPDGQWLATGEFDTDLVEIRDARTGQRQLQLGTNAPGQTWSAQFGNNSHYLAVAFRKGITIYEIAAGTAADGDGRLLAKPVTFSAGAARNLNFSPDGRSLAFTTFKDDRLHFWGFDSSPRPADVLFRVPVGVQMESFTPEGQLVAIDENGRIVTLEVRTGKEISSFQARSPSAVISVGICLSPDGARFATTSDSQRGLVIWDFKAAKLLYSLPDEPGTVYWVAWSPDSRRLAIARDNGDVAIWNLDAIDQVLAKQGLNP